MKDHLKLDIDWDEPEDLSGMEGETTVAIIDKPHLADLGFSPQFPDGIVLYFRADQPHALVFEGEAAARFLTQARAMLVYLGIVEVQAAEGYGGGPTQPVKSSLPN